MSACRRQCGPDPGNHDYIGGLAQFTAAELLDCAEEQLATVFGQRNAVEIGRAHAVAEGCVVRGQRLTREGRGVDGVVWTFR